MEPLQEERLLYMAHVRTFRPRRMLNTCQCGYASTTLNFLGCGFHCVTCPCIMRHCSMEYQLGLAHNTAMNTHLAKTFQKKLSKTFSRLYMRASVLKNLKSVIKLKWQHFRQIISGRVGHTITDPRPIHRALNLLSRCFVKWTAQYPRALSF